MDNTNVINEIRSKTDIVDVISSYLPLTRKGKNFFKMEVLWKKKKEKIIID